ncbi:MAG TPA: iron-sulfur protein [Gemmatimonadetes bacterium]|nr:iron-sulfur protein [Gemmatimonadota bacterium]
MADKHKPVVVQSREKVERNRSALDRWIDSAAWLDRPADVVQPAILKFYEALGGPGQGLKSLLHGTKPLGHPLHPALTAVPLGGFTVMFLADWLAIFFRAFPPLIGTFALIIGILGMVASAATGYTDYTGTSGRARRYATIHGLVMTIVLLVMIASLLLRYQTVGGLVFAGILVSSLAYLMVLFGAFLGGHLSFGMGTGVNRNAFVAGVTDWTDVGSIADYREGKMVRAQAGDMPVLLVRLGDRLNVIAATCSHAGGPLDEGKLEGDIVICPWHSSRFCVADGTVKDGPATFDQPAFLVREEKGKVQVRLPAPLD